MSSEQPLTEAGHNDHHHSDHAHGAQHGSHHHHHLHHGPGHYARANEEHYDQTAHEFDDYRHAKGRAKRSAIAIRNTVQVDKEKTSVLEFACGTGLVSKELSPYVHEITGVDISQGVVDRYNDRFTEEGANDRFRAIRAELKGEEGELGGRKFDLIFCASAYHHFDSIEDVTRTLVSHLEPKGALIVIDNAKTTNSTIPEQYRHMISHNHGFGEDAIQKVFESAGLELASYTIVPTDEGDNELFIAKGTKKST